MCECVYVDCVECFAQLYCYYACAFWWFVLVAMVFHMFCSAVLVAWLLLKQCCVEICGMLFVMYGSGVFSRVFCYH